MKTLKINIKNKKAEELIKILVDLNLISIISEPVKTPPAPVATKPQLPRSIPVSTTKNNTKPTSMEQMREIINASRNRKR